MSFFDKIKDVMYVNSPEQFLFGGMFRKYLERLSLKSVHSTRICLTVSGH